MVPAVYKLQCSACVDVTTRARAKAGGHVHSRRARDVAAIAAAAGGGATAQTIEPAACFGPLAAPLAARFHAPSEEIGGAADSPAVARYCHGVLEHRKAAIQHSGNFGGRNA